MPELAVRPALPPARLLGYRSHWRRDGALVGVVTAYGGAALGLFGLSLHPFLLACAVAGGLLGALLGEVAPVVLDRTRGVIPLPALVLGLPVVAAAMATSVAVGAAWVVGAPVVVAVEFAAVAAAVQVALFWLPYTMAVVLRAPRWPVVMAACLLGPLTGPIAKWVILSLLA